MRGAVILGTRVFDERLLDAIYASTFDDGALQQALSGLARACDSRVCGVFRLGPDGLDFELAHGMPQGFMAQFAAQTPDDPRVVHALSQPTLSLQDDSRTDMRKAMQVSGTDVLARQWDLPWTLATVCAREADAAWALYLSRSASEGPADSVQSECFSVYSKHFARALQLRIEARTRMRAWHCTRHGEATRIARLTVDAGARVIRMDDDAHALMRQAEGITIRRGIVVLATPTATARLHDLAAYLASAPQIGPLAAGFELAQRRPPGTLCVRLDAGTGEIRRRQRLLTLWLERRSRQSIDIHTDSAPTLRQREVLRLLERGLATSGIAAQLGIGDATVRTHVKHLLTLTGTHNRRACIAEARNRGWL